MSKAIHFVYDDRARVPDLIAGIVGERPFGSIVRNRRPLSDWVIDCARHAGIEAITRLVGADDLAALRQGLRMGPEAVCHIHFAARGAVTDTDGMALLLSKIGLADGTLFDSAHDPLVAGFHSAGDYET